VIEVVSASRRGDLRLFYLGEPTIRQPSPICRRPIRPP